MDPNALWKGVHVSSPSLGYSGANTLQQYVEDTFSHLTASAKRWHNLTRKSLCSEFESTILPN
eukprot:4491055-Amphidinium_carterae.1